jgi:hypothetical protein
MKNQKGSSPKFRGAQILLKADADGPARPAIGIAEAFSGRVLTIEDRRTHLERLIHSKSSGTASSILFGRRRL